MLKNYFKIAFRNLRNYKGYTFINVFGLAVGIAVCVLIFAYVSFELSYDRYHSKSNRIYRLTLELPQVHLGVTPSLISPTLQRMYPEVKAGVRLNDVGSYQPLLIRNGEKVFEERNFAYADSSLFNIFDFTLLAGNPGEALTRPNTIVISRDMAQKYFGSLNPVGKTLQVGSRDFEVSGVMENIPPNSHFRYDFFASLVTRSGWSELQDDAWRAANFFTYLLLDENARVAELEQKVNQFKNQAITENEFAKMVEVNFEPLTAIHLYSDVDEDITPQGDVRYVMAASAIAIIILIIACINYMNLATARSARRSKEVGIRKVLGSERRHLVGQFYGEAAFLSLLSIGISVLLIELFLPWFNQLAGTAIAINYSSFKFLGMLGAIGLFVTLVAGSYPALMLSSFNPSDVLKGKKTTGDKSRLRKGLVIFQFAASVFLIISTMVIFQQIDYIQQKELGYKQDNILVLTAYGDVEEHFDTFRSELRQLPGVEEAAMASDTPTNIRAGYGIDVEGIDEGPNFNITGLRASPEITGALHIELVAGKTLTDGDFARANPEEGEAEYVFLVNEATARRLGIEPQKLVGRTAVMSGRTGTIKGVVKDFHFMSLHRQIEPLVIFPTDGFSKLLVSFKPGDTRNTLEQTRAVWNNLFPQYPFEYDFLDQEYNALYQQETRAAGIFSSFSVLAIFIACLGLVGLSSYMVERRSREIGVRKVLGATVSQIITLFSKDFVLLVMIGFLISLPVAWYVMQQWLQNFAYKIEIGLPVVLLSGLLVLFVALFTVGYQAIRAARLNPVDTLRNE